MEKIFCERLESLRNGRSYDVFGEFVGIPGEVVRKHCQGISEPKAGQLSRYSVALGVSVDWLLGLAQKPAQTPKIIASGKNSQAAGRDILAGPSAETSAEVERLRGEVAALERALAMFAPKKGGKR